MLGQTYLLDGRSLTIVGVLSPAIEIGNLADIDLWAPLPLDAAAPRGPADTVLGSAATRRPQATLASADAELREPSSRRRFKGAFLQTNTGWQAHVRSTKTVLASNDTWVILALLGVIVVFVLLIACANRRIGLAHLVARRQEQAVRLALGASRWQVIRPVLVESVVFGLAGGLVGLLLAHAGLQSSARSRPISSCGRWWRSTGMCWCCARCCRW